MHQRTLKKVLPKLNKTVWKMHFMVHFIGHARFLQLFNRRCHINSIIIFVFVHSFFQAEIFWNRFLWILYHIDDHFNLCLYANYQLLDK